MAYVLGYLYADGALIDTDRSSRTRYTTISSKDKQIILQIRKVLRSRHNIHENSAGVVFIRGRKCFKNTQYILKIGSKQMFNDLLTLGSQVHKSLVMSWTNVPDTYLPSNTVETCSETLIIIHTEIY